MAGKAEGGMFRNGEEVRRYRVEELEDDLMPGELLRSEGRLSGSRTVFLTGDIGGKASSEDLRGVRTRLGEEGLAGRSWGERRIWPEPLTPGIERALDMAGAEVMLVAESDRVWEPESGEAVRGRKGMAVGEGAQA